MARRDDCEYREYLKEEQRSQRGCIARRMQPALRHGLLGSHITRTAAAIAFALAAGCSGVNVQNEVYQTLDEARAAGAIERGWVPQGLPPSATDLRAAHLDDGRRWGVFSFDTAQPSGLTAILGEEITSGAVECDAPGRLEWWPRILQTPIDLDRVRSTGLRLYRARDGRLTFAVNWSLGRAYYWRNR